MRNRIVLLIIFMLISASLACSLTGAEPTEAPPPETDTPAPPIVTPTPETTYTPTATATNTPTATITPTPIATTIPSFVQDWNDYQIVTLCLDIQVSYPQFDEPLDDPIVELVEIYLSRMGIQTVSSGSNCDASLVLALDLVALSSRYTDNETNETKTCYTGSGAEGTMTLSASGMDDLVVELYEHYTPGATMGCIETPPVTTNFTSTWVPEVTKGLIDYWGISAIIAALEPTGYDVHDFYASGEAFRLARSYPEGYELLIPYLIPIVGEGTDAYPDSSVWFALNLIEEMGPAAIELVPYLITSMEIQIDSGDMFSYEQEYAWALADITGKAASTDPDFWWDWWEVNAP